MRFAFIEASVFAAASAFAFTAVLPYDAQLGIGNCKLREATFQADHNRRKHQYDRFAQTREAGKMNSDFTDEITLVF